METIKLEAGDKIIVDPCYIKSVKSHGDLRFDALRTTQVLHDGGDGEFPVNANGKKYWLGVDSGRIWELTAEFSCDIEVDSGFSGHVIIRTDDNN